MEQKKGGSSNSKKKNHKGPKKSGGIETLPIEIAAEDAELSRKYARFIARLWQDDAFRAAFKANPEQVLRDQGFDVPDDLDIVVCEDVGNIFHFVIPLPLANISVESLGAGKGDPYASWLSLATGTTRVIGPTRATRILPTWNPCRITRLNEH